MDKITARLEANAGAVAEFSKVQNSQLQELQKQTEALQDIARESRQKIYKQSREQ
jgi:hypothetical protein